MERGSVFKNLPFESAEIRIRANRFRRAGIGENRRMMEILKRFKAGYVVGVFMCEADAFKDFPPLDDFSPIEGSSGKELPF